MMLLKTSQQGIYCDTEHKSIRPFHVRLRLLRRVEQDRLDRYHARECNQVLHPTQRSTCLIHLYGSQFLCLLHMQRGRLISCHAPTS